MNKKTQLSIDRLTWAITYITGLAPIEVKRSSNVRRKQLGSAYETMSLHAHKLGLETPHLGIWYDPAQYLDHALKIQILLDAYLEVKNENTL